jgi:hypothetical protein
VAARCGAPALMPTPALTRLDVAAEPDRWRGAGFGVADDEVVIGAVIVRFVEPADGGGIVGWELDGQTVANPPPAHPNGAYEIDHVVLMTPDLDATVDDLAVQGFEARRTRAAGPGVTQVFYRFANGPILEVVGPVTSPHPQLWGMVCTTRDLDATVAMLGDARIGRSKDAVQPGRRIATVRPEAGLGTAMAFMST